jgi:hypothetical protein
MNERLIPISLAFQGETDADGVMGAYVPQDFRLIKVSHFVTATGTPTAITIDIQDDTADVETAMDISSAGITALTTPAEIAADSVIEIDLNTTGGTTPTATGEIVLWGYIGE